MIDAILCDSTDPSAGMTIGAIRIVGADTLMRGPAGQQRLAREVLRLASTLAG